MKTRLLFLCLLTAYTLLFTGGCWDQGELEELALVQAIGIDYLPQEKKFEVTTSIIRPGELGAGGMEGGIEGDAEPMRLITTRGKTLSGAMEQQNAFLSRRAYYAHNDVVIVGEKLASQGMHLILDRLTRERDTRLTLNVFVTGDNVKEFLRGGSRLEISLPKEIRQMKLRTSQRSLRGEANLLDFIQNLLQSGQDPYLPVVEMREETPTSPREAEIGETGKDGKRENEVNGENINGEKEESTENKVGYPKMYGTAVFREDRLAGFLDGYETKGLLYVEESLIDSRETINDPEGKPGEIVLITIDNSSRILTEVVNGKPRITVKIEEEGDICCQTSATNLFTPENFRRMEQSKEEVIKGYVKDVLEKTRKWETDIFGFGNKIKQNHPGYWEDLEKGEWREEIYPKLEVEIQVESNIRRTGLIERPPFYEYYQ